MADLCAALETAGCSDVRSYIQSGNLIFEAENASVLESVREVVTGLTSASDNVFFRTPAELAEIVERRPFGDLTTDRTLKLYIVFLADAPKRLALPLVDEKQQLELIDVHGREAYVVSRPRPSSMYGFPNAFVETHLGVAATSRSWNTVVKLLGFTARDLAS